MTRAPLLLSLLACWSASGCLADEHQAWVPLPAADLQTFAAEVQPILAARCANPSCHGMAGRPLEVFAPQRHRADPADLHRDLPLTEAELAANFFRASAFLLDGRGPADCPLLTKPLAESAGGVAHVGGAQFYDTDEVEYARLLAWIEEASWR